MKLYLLFALIPLFVRQEKENYDLTIEFSGIHSNVGNIVVAIYRPKDHFPDRDTRYKYLLIHPKNNTIPCAVFSKLPKDKYAVAAYFDENKNLYLDKNIVGYPTEKYGFSNNARSKFSAPTFEMAAFELTKEKKIKIHLY